MATFNWCKKQKGGIELIRPNENLSKEYLESARETLEVIKQIEYVSRIWTATAKYYFKYFLVYSFLMKLGIKCKIHECTILVVEILEKNISLPKGLAKGLASDKKLRIDNQYYLKNREVKIDIDELTELFLEVKFRLNRLTNEEIKKAREVFS